MQIKLSNSLRLEQLYLIPFLEDVNDQKSNIFCKKRDSHLKSERLETIDLHLKFNFAGSYIAKSLRQFLK